MQRAIGYRIWLGGRTKKDTKVTIEDWLPLSSDVVEDKPQWQPNKEDYSKMMKRLTRPQKQIK